MLRIIGSSIIVTLLFLSLFAFAFTIQPAKAQSGGTITINPNGSISSPVPANITTSNNVTYTFTGNNYLPIVVNRSNIIINGRGYTLQGVFSLSSVSNVTIKNTIITDSGIGIFLGFSSGNVLSGNNVANSYYGIFLVSSSGNVLSGNNITANGYGIDLNNGSDNNTLSGNKITANFYIGIRLGSSSGNVLFGNNITANGYGIDLLPSSDNNTLFGNDVRANSCGIYLGFSSGNVLSGNVMASNLYNFRVEGSVLSDFVNHVDTSNLVDGKPVCYLMNQSNIVINPQTYPEGVGYLGLVNCKNVTVQGLTLSKNSQGLLLAFTNDSKISGNNVTTNDNGIYLYSSSDNTFYHNNFINNTMQVYSDGSPNTWDNGYPSGGNYWSDYRTTCPNATEYDSSAIWNTPYFIDANNTDRYPLMGPFHTFGVGTWSGLAYSVDTVSNSTITNLSFNQPAKTLTFNVTGPSGTMGFCRVAIPKSLMSGGWIVTVNGTLLSPSNLSIAKDANYTYIYFTYHHSTEAVQITSISVIPEFQPSMLLPLFMIITLLGAIVLKKKRNARTR
jgi:parallel beta-helix repeat protein